MIISRFQTRERSSLSRVGSGKSVLSFVLVLSLSPWGTAYQIARVIQMPIRKMARYSLPIHLSALKPSLCFHDAEACLVHHGRMPQEYHLLPLQGYTLMIMKSILIFKFRVGVYALRICAENRFSGCSSCLVLIASPDSKDGKIPISVWFGYYVFSGQAFGM